MLKKKSFYPSLAGLLLLSANVYSASFFPLQTGNTWTYFWGYKLPESCRTGTGPECCIEGATTTSKIERSIHISGAGYFILTTYVHEPGNQFKAIHSDTITSEEDSIYTFNSNGDRLWLNFRSDSVKYTYNAAPGDSFGVKYFNNSTVTVPPYAPSYAINCATVTDSMQVLNSNLFGIFKQVEYFDAASPNKLLWIDNYWPGIGLVYSEASYDRFSGYTRHLTSAIIDGDSVTFHTSTINRISRIVKRSTSPDNNFFDLRGRRIRSIGTTTNAQRFISGICVGQKGKVYFLDSGKLRK